MGLRVVKGTSTVRLEFGCLGLAVVVTFLRMGIKTSVS